MGVIEQREKLRMQYYSMETVEWVRGEDPDTDRGLGK